jgi:hypothetical protein
MMADINLRALDAAINDAFASVVATVSDEMQAVIEDLDEFADVGLSNRDIIDTGRLRDSQVVDVRDGRAEWTFDPHDPATGYPYAAAIYAGFAPYGNENAFVPGRNFPERAIDRASAPKALAAELQLRGIDARVVETRRIS